MNTRVYFAEYGVENIFVIVNTSGNRQKSSQIRFRCTDKDDLKILKKFVIILGVRN